VSGGWLDGWLVALLLQAEQGKAVMVHGVVWWLVGGGAGVGAKWRVRLLVTLTNFYVTLTILFCALTFFCELTKALTFLFCELTK